MTESNINLWKEVFEKCGIDDDKIQNALLSGISLKTLRLVDRQDGELSLREVLNPCFETKPNQLNVILKAICNCIYETRRVNSNNGTNSLDPIMEELTKRTSEIKTEETNPLFNNTRINIDISSVSFEQILNALNRDLENPIPVLKEFYTFAMNNIPDQYHDEAKKIISSVQNNYHKLLSEMIQAIDFNIDAINADDEMTASTPVINLLHSIYYTYFSNHKPSILTSVTCNSASNCPSSTKSADSKAENPRNTRRDMLFYYEGLVVIFAEFKSRLVEMEDCLKQVHQNMGNLNSRIYGKFPFIFCFTQSGRYLQLHIFLRQSGNKFLDKPRKNIDCDTIQFDLIQTIDRLKLVKIFINALRILNGLFLQNLLPMYKLPYLLNKYTITKSCSSVSIKYQDDLQTGDVVMYKKIQNLTQYQLANWQNLLCIYQLLKENKIMYSYKSFDYTYTTTKTMADNLKMKEFAFKYKQSNDKRYFDTVVCTSKAMDDYRIVIKRENVEAAKKLLLHVGKSLESLHNAGFVHRDIRLPNILYNSVSEEFLLIDFDCSGKIGEPIKTKLTCYPDDWKEGYEFKIEDDLVLYGKLIQDLAESVNLPSTITDLATNLITNPKNFFSSSPRTLRNNEKNIIKFSFFKHLE